MAAAILIIICSSVLGALSLVLFNLFLAYPDQQTNWDNLAFHLRLVVGLAAAGIATGIAFAILKKTNGRIQTITILFIAIFVTTGFLIFGIRSAEKPVSVSNVKPTNRYEFSSDWVSENVRHWEQVLAPMKGKPAVKALEIGSFEGRSALWFLENVLTDPTSSITCVDVFDNAVVEARYDKNIAISGVPNKVIKVKARSDDALKRFSSGTYDFIYIDGSHVARDVLVDAVLAWELLKPDGVVIFDDYEWVGFGPRLGRHKTPKLAINAFLEVYTPYAEILYKKNQLVLRKKRDVDLDDDGRFGRIARRLQLLLD
jgi:predicted O-methyltransferase YrrM